jgi:hypothetical protein
MGTGRTSKYDPANIVLTVGDKDIAGFAEGTFIEVERAVDAFTTTVGSDGEATRTKSQNRMGTIKVTLQQASLSNDTLQALAQLDEDSSTGAVPIMLKDFGGKTLVQAKKGWVKKKANSPFANTSENREWIIESGQLLYTVGSQSDL